MRYIPLLLRYFAFLLPFPGSSPFTFAMPPVFCHFSDWPFRPDGGLTRPPPQTVPSHSRNAIVFWHFFRPALLAGLPDPSTHPLSLSQCHWTWHFSRGRFRLNGALNPSLVTFTMPLDFDIFLSGTFGLSAPRNPLPPPPSNDPSTLTPAMPSGIRPVGALSPPDQSPLTLVIPFHFRIAIFSDSTIYLGNGSSERPTM